MDIKVSIPFAELRNENDREYVVRITVRELDFSRTRTHDQQFGWLVGWCNRNSGELDLHDQGRTHRWRIVDGSAEVQHVRVVRRAAEGQAAQGRGAHATDAAAQGHLQHAPSIVRQQSPPRVAAVSTRSRGQSLHCQALVLVAASGPAAEPERRRAAATATTTTTTAATTATAPECSQPYRRWLGCVERRRRWCPGCRSSDPPGVDRRSTSRRYAPRDRGTHSHRAHAH